MEEGELALHIGIHGADHPVMVFKPNGDIFVHGKLVENDKEVVQGFREWLMKAQPTAFHCVAPAHLAYKANEDWLNFTIPQAILEETHRRKVYVRADAYDDKGQNQNEFKIFLERTEAGLKIRFREVNS